MEKHPVEAVILKTVIILKAVILLRVAISLTAFKSSEKNHEITFIDMNPLKNIESENFFSSETIN